MTSHIELVARLRDGIVTKRAITSDAAMTDMSATVALMYEAAFAIEAQAKALSLAVEALDQIIEMNVQYAIDRWGDASKAEDMACVQVARKALSSIRETET